MTERGKAKETTKSSTFIEYERMLCCFFKEKGWKIRMLRLNCLRRP